MSPPRSVPEWNGIEIDALRSLQHEAGPTRRSGVSFRCRAGLAALFADLRERRPRRTHFLRDANFDHRRPLARDGSLERGQKFGGPPDRLAMRAERARKRGEIG